MGFEEAKALQARLSAEVDAAAAALNRFPKNGPMGLTEDAIKFSPGYRDAKRRFDGAFQRLRNFNAYYTKAFSKQISTARRA